MKVVRAPEVAIPEVLSGAAECSAVQCVGDPPTIHAAQSWVALKDLELSHAAEILKTLGTFPVAQI